MTRKSKRLRSALGSAAEHNSGDKVVAPSALEEAVSKQMASMRDQLDHKLDVGLVSMRREMQVFDTPVSGLADDVNALKSAVGGLEGLRDDVGGLDGKLQSVQENVSQLSENVGSLDRKLQSVQSSVENQQSFMETKFGEQQGLLETTLNSLLQEFAQRMTRSAVPSNGPDRSGLADDESNLRQRKRKRTTSRSRRAMLTRASSVTCRSWH